MAQTIRIENSSHSCEVFFDDRDFEDILEKYLGNEAADYYRNRIDQLTKEIERLKEVNSDD